jgi:hypothetical protein
MCNYTPRLERYPRGRTEKWRQENVWEMPYKEGLKSDFLPIGSDFSSIEAS